MWPQTRIEQYTVRCADPPPSVHPLSAIRCKPCMARAHCWQGPVAVDSGLGEARPGRVPRPFEVSRNGSAREAAIARTGVKQMSRNVRQRGSDRVPVWCDSRIPSSDMSQYSQTLLPGQLLQPDTGDHWCDHVLATEAKLNNCDCFRDSGPLSAESLAQGHR